MVKKMWEVRYLSLINHLFAYILIKYSMTVFKVGATHILLFLFSPGVCNMLVQSCK